MMDPVVTALVLRSLDGLSARSIATAQNVANASTPGYRPLRVSFERMLAAAASGSPETIAAVRPRLEQGAPGETLRLDLELATASSTAGRYAALVELLGRQMQLHGLSIMGNK